jgi:hypothetical protein
MSPSLPQELVDIIIDHLHDDQQSLLACSLVCQNWVEPSRIHKFASSTIKWETRQKSFNDFPIALQYLQDLTVIISSGFIETSLPKLPNANLRRLCVEGLSILGTWINLFSPVSLHPYTDLTTLELCHCIIPNFSTLTRLIYHFPNLASLSIRQTLFRSSSVPNELVEKNDTRSPPLTGRLYVTEPGVIYGEEQGPSALVALASFPVRFQSVEVESSREHCAAELNELFRVCGSALQTVYLSHLFVLDGGRFLAINLD